MTKWRPHKVKDIDKAKKIPEKKICPKHGVYYGKFCLKCDMERRGVAPDMRN